MFSITFIIICFRNQNQYHFIFGQKEVSRFYLIILFWINFKSFKQIQLIYPLKKQRFN